MTDDTRKDAPDSIPLIFGEVLFDQFLDGSRVLGGAPFNVAWHLQGFGRDPLVASAVGADRLGREALQRMEEWGMSTRGVRIDPDHPTGRVMATVVDGEPAFEIGSEQAYDYVDAESVLSALDPLSPALVYHGTLALRSDRTWSAAKRILQTTRAPSFVDVNLRDPWWTPDRLRWCLDTATWLKVNEAELAILAGEPCDGRESCVAAALGLAGANGLEVVLVTLGREGALAVVGEQAISADGQGLADDDVVDTVGAGDAFCAVAILGLLEGWAPDILLQRANAFAADLCRVQGATTQDRSLYARHRSRWRGS